MEESRRRGGKRVSGESWKRVGGEAAREPAESHGRARGATAQHGMRERGGRERHRIRGGRAGLAVPGGRAFGEGARDGTLRPTGGRLRGVGAKNFTRGGEARVWVGRVVEEVAYGGQYAHAPKREGAGAHLRAGKSACRQSEAGRTPQSKRKSPAEEGLSSRRVRSHEPVRSAGGQRGARRGDGGLAHHGEGPAPGL